MHASGPGPRIAFDHAVLDATERRFWREIWESTPPDVAAAHGIEVSTFGPIEVLVVADLPRVPMLNLILGAGVSGSVEQGLLPASVEWVESRGVDYYVPLTAGSTEAEAWLAREGFGKGYGWMKFVRDTSPPDLPESPGLEVVELATGEGREFGAIVAAGFGLPEWAEALFSRLPGRPGWHCYVANVDGEPRAAAAALIDNGVAEFGLAATLESARGRGCQTALLRRRIADMAEEGCRLLFVETGELLPDRPSASYRNILRAGFEEAYLRPNWQRQRS